MKCPQCDNPNARYKVSRKREMIKLERVSKKRTDFTIICKNCGELPRDHVKEILCESCKTIKYGLTTRTKQRYVDHKIDCEIMRNHTRTASA